MSATSVGRRGMRWFQIRLHLLFFAMIVIAAFFAGRAQMVENAQRAAADAAKAEEHSRSAQQIARFWERVALQERIDLADELHMAGRMRLQRQGVGGSWVSRGVNDTIRPRGLRWSIAFSDDEAEYARQLDFLSQDAARTIPESRRASPPGRSPAPARPTAATLHSLTLFVNNGK